MRLKTEGHWFIDEMGRRVVLRGVNLGGSTKVPTTPNGATHLKTDFSDHQDVSFVGRPFPLDEADEHYSRLKAWGFNSLRFLTTWEAIEHAGPGNYDNKYLDYLQEVVRIAGEHGFYVFMDPHQDVWSRMTGGDGAPGWTFEKVGLDFTTFGENHAAKVMQYHYPDNYVEMEWFQNYQRFACATMFTVFFGSETFAPDLKIEGKSAQKYLQDHFIASLQQVASRVRDFDHVIGFNSLNEPGNGFIGISDLGQYPDLTPPGVSFTPFDAIAAGSGIPREIRKIKLRLLWLRDAGTTILNPNGISSWLAEENDVWLNHGIWEKNGNEAKLLQPEHFKYNQDGSPVDFLRDYLRPFNIRYTSGIREIMPESIMFIEGEPNNPCIDWQPNDPKGIVNASHWYDGFTLVMKSYRSWFSVDTQTLKPVFFSSRVRKLFTNQLSARKKASESIHNGVPTLIGEFGIPYDMQKKKAFETGNYNQHVKALSLYYDILDELQLHSTQWNYTADNNNQWGDLWNTEDLSIFSRDQQDDPEDINSGGRAIKGFSRPYPMKTNGTPIAWKFDRKKKQFDFKFHSRSKDNETIVYIPETQFPNGIMVEINPTNKFTLENQLLKITTEKEGEYSLIVNSK